MRLDAILPAVDARGAGTEILDLAFDDRRVREGTLFFCVSGFTRDGHDFAQAAIAKGAVAVVVERPLGLSVPEVVVPSVRAAMGAAADAFYGQPSAGIDVVGVTGTNGKTTTAYLVRALLESSGRQCGLVGTVESIVAGHSSQAVRTTPEAIELHEMLAAMRAGGDDSAAIEVSSHALDLGRVAGVKFACSIFTNLTQDHLDFHHTMDAYWESKRRLFTDLPCGTPIINIDDDHGRVLATQLEGAVTSGLSPDADWTVAELQTDMLGSSFQLLSPDGDAHVTTKLPGEFNVRNMLGAAAATATLGVSLDLIVEALGTAARVPGRFEPIDRGQPFAVLVDYAHTPDSLENVLDAAKGIAEGKVICVVGCGGDRDTAKRPLMGAVLAAHSDVGIITSDNPRSEDPEAIVAEVSAGAGTGTRVVVDRREAIALAVSEAERGDVVLIAGKGHEQGQEFADGIKLPFDDRIVAAEALAEAGWA
ncbi:MAG: UDP-N-acetylmuramoyl-L-alanyl-D-glutamate--2,6-diaminopimelate ligase [Actinomycetes bacterium]